jgi:phage baseplate assembly protein V
MISNLRNLIAIGKAKLFKRGKTLQEVDLTIRQGEDRKDLEHALPYGFTHLPHIGADTLSVFPAGDKGFGLVISVYDRRYQLPLPNVGDVAIYDHEGQCVHLSREGIVFKSSKSVTIDAPKTHIKGDVIIDKECTISDIAFTPHIHSESIGTYTDKPQ